MKFDQITEEWILSELEKIKYSFKLNDVIRYNMTRNETLETKTQSVTEHLYNMLVLAYYFRNLEDPKGQLLDFEKVTKMILMHDMVEIETGDTVMHQKSFAKEEVEKQAIETVAKNSPEFVSLELELLWKEYNNYETMESKFVKAIDKIEPQFYHSVFRDPKMLLSVCNVEERDRNELKRREIYKKCGFKIIEKFALTIRECKIFCVNELN